MSYATKAVRGAAATATAFAGQQVISLIVNILLARMLLKADFGIVALVLALTTLLDVFAEMGVSVALIQKKELTEKAIRTSFFASITSTLVISTILFFSADAFARFYNSQVLDNLLRIAAVSYIFKGNYAIYRCLLLRDMKYTTVSRNDVIASSVYGFTAVILAWKHFGPFSMVIGQLVSNIIQLVLGFLATRIYPVPSFDREELRNLLGFGLWVSVGRVMGSAAGKVDSFVIGKALDMTSLGVYNVAQRLVLIVPQVITQALDQVTYPIYAKMQDTPRRIEDNYWNSLSVISMISLPAVSLLYLVSDPVVPMLFGAKWASSVPIARIMCVFTGASCLGGGIFASIVYASGKPKWTTVMNLFRILILPLFVIGGSKWGVVGVAWGFSIYGIIGRIFNQCILYYEFNYSLKRYFKIVTAPVLMNVGVTLVMVFAGSSLWANPPETSHFIVRTLWVLVNCAVWIAMYVGLWALLMNSNFKKTIGIFRSALQGK